MNSREMLDNLARSAKYPVIPRIRVVRDGQPGPWVILGAYFSRAAADNAVTQYARAHAVEGKSFQATVMEFSHPDYVDALAHVRFTRRTRSRTRKAQGV